MTPTARTLKHLRELGYLAAVVEHWNPHARIRQDLFGIIDVLAIAPLSDDVNHRIWMHAIPRARNETAPWKPVADTLAIQATTGANVAARITKLQASLALPRLLAAGWQIEVWGWRKLASSRKWELRREVVTLP